MAMDMMCGSPAPRHGVNKVYIVDCAVAQAVQGITGSHAADEQQRHASRHDGSGSGQERAYLIFALT
jgi:hypothetical protein